MKTKLANEPENEFATKALRGNKFTKMFLKIFFLVILIAIITVLVLL